MALTNFPNGITSFGIPVFPGPIPSQGQAWFVKPGTGSDGNSGKDPDNALATLSKAHSLATANQNDVVYLFSESGSASATTDYQSTALTWSKNLTHLIGVSSWPAISNRARIAQLSTATGVDGLLTVSAQGCLFANFSIVQGVDDATSTNALTVSGYRNRFHNVNIQGLLHDTMGAGGGLYCVTLSAAEENIFEQCVIGADTIGQGAGNANLRIISDSRDNIFKDCTFLTTASAAGFLHGSIADDGLLGFTMFDDCKFINSPDNAGSTTTMTSCFTDSKATTDFDGVVCFNRPFVYGASQIGAGGAYVYVGVGSGDTDASTAGLAEAST